MQDGCRTNPHWTYPPPPGQNPPPPSSPDRTIKSSCPGHVLFKYYFFNFIAPAVDFKGGFHGMVLSFGVANFELIIACVLPE